MIADGDARQLGAARREARSDQRQVGRATAGIEHEHELHAGERVLEVVRVMIEPVVERGLRLFEQA